QNPTRFLTEAHQTIAALGENAAPTEIFAGSRWLGSSSSIQDLNYNRESAQKLRELLLNDDWKWGQKKHPKTFEQALRNVAPGDLKRLLRLAPFLYGNDGLLLPNTRQSIENVSSETFDNFYRDRFQEHLAPTVVRVLQERHNQVLL